MERGNFGARLSARTQEKGTLCGGIDPSPKLLRDWGLNDNAAGLERFALEAAATMADIIAIVKLQSAYFERHGSRGIRVMEDTISTLRGKGALVILDAKRGDIGSTTAAYAEAYLDRRSPLAVDALTAHPFLGFESLRPMIDVAMREGSGLFVLARTSNPEAAEVQTAQVGGNLTVSDSILERVSALNKDVEPLGSIGVVVGATVGNIGSAIEHLNGPVLVPGVGAQGATLSDAYRLLGDHPSGVIPSVSRGLLDGGPEGFRQRVTQMAAECRKESRS